MWLVGEADVIRLLRSVTELARHVALGMIFG